MEFCIGEKFFEHPVAQDIVRAVDAGPHDEGWFISLEADNDDLIEAFALKGGGFRLTSAEDAGRFEATASIEAALLKTIFVKFLNGDTTWRTHCEWRSTPPEELRATAPMADSKSALRAQANNRPSGTPKWFSIGIVGVIAIFTVTFNFFPGFLFQLQSRFPFVNSGVFIFAVVASLIVVGALIFVAAKIIEARRTAGWPQASGRIVKAGMEARHVQRAGEATSVRNVAAVAYEFSALGKKWSGHRINMLGEPGGAEAAAKLALYRVGAAVLVHYDPADPGNCVLEHELPKGFGKGCAMSLAILAAIIGAITVVAMHGPRWIEVYKPGPHFFFALAAGGFGLMALLFFLGVRRVSAEAKSWPVARGKIVSSGTEAFNKDEDGRTRTYYTAAVEYAYSVQGVDYRSRQIALSVESSGSESSAAAMATRYGVGNVVDVHYDPANPSRAALEIGGNFHWLIFAVAIVCFAIAVYAGGVFG